MKRARRILPVLLLLLLAAGFFLRADPAFLRDRRDAKQYPPEQFLADRLDREAERVYLAAYDLSAQELEKLWTEVYNNRPDLFFVSASYEFSTFNDRVLYVSPRYEVGLQRNDDARRRYRVSRKTGPIWKRRSTSTTGSSCMLLMMIPWQAIPPMTCLSAGPGSARLTPRAIWRCCSNAASPADW